MFPCLFRVQLHVGYPFGPYDADLHSGELLKNGVKVRLQSQSFQLLMLLQRLGELVTREEICQTLWSADTFVEFDRDLGTAVNKIHKVLKNSASEPRFVASHLRRVRPATLRPAFSEDAPRSWPLLILPNLKLVTRRCLPSPNRSNSGIYSVRTTGRLVPQSIQSFSAAAGRP